MVGKTEKQVLEICDWLSRRLQHLRSQGAVVGISGGVDSAVTAALARKVLGKRVLCLILPCHSAPEEIDDAKQVVEHLDLPSTTLDISYAYDSLVHLLPKGDNEANACLKARLRMLVLYHYAARHNYLVLGACNRSEWEIGFFTSHGDGAADLYPLLHLLKEDVYGLATHFNFPLRVIEKPCSSHLSDGRTDQSRLGFSYSDLDSYLTEGAGALSVPVEVQARIRQMQEESLHKRLPVDSIAMSHDADGVRDIRNAAQKAPAEDHETYDKSIEALTLISKAITSDQYLEDILRLIVMVTAEVMKSSVCSLWLIDEKEAVLRLRATQSINSEYLKERALKVGEGIVGKVAAENRPSTVPNVLEDPFFKEKDLARGMGLVSMLSVPMRVKDRVIGVVNCYTSHPHVFSELQMNVLTAVANQAAVAIENTELMVKTRVIQEELERRKIIERAKDLIMKRFNLTGEDAYRWLQKRSMNTRKSMREVAEAVLLAMEG